MIFSQVAFLILTSKEGFQNYVAGGFWFLKKNSNLTQKCEAAKPIILRT